MSDLGSRNEDGRPGREADGGRKIFLVSGPIHLRSTRTDSDGGWSKFLKIDRGGRRTKADQVFPAIGVTIYVVVIYIQLIICGVF